MLKFLITGDIQAHNWRQFSYTRKNGYNSRLWNCAKVFDVVRKEGKARGINKAVFNGDIFEENSYIDVEVFDLIYRKLECLHDEGFEIVINLGNHDVAGQFGRRILHALRAFRKIATVVEEPTLVWNHIWMVPWNSSPDRIKAAIAEGARLEKASCLVGHFGVQGATTGPNSYLVRNPIKLRDLQAENFGLVLLSDYHTRQRLDKNVWYLGSPLQHSFGEIHRPCIWNISLDRQGLFESEKVYTNFPQFRRWDFGTDLSHFRKDSKSWRGDYVSVRAHVGLPESAIKRQASKVGFFVQIIRAEESDSLRTKPTIGGEHSIRRTFRKYVRREAAGGEVRRKRLLKLGQKLYRGE